MSSDDEGDFGPVLPPSLHHEVEVKPPVEQHECAPPPPPPPPPAASLQHPADDDALPRKKPRGDSTEQKEVSTRVVGLAAAANREALAKLPTATQYERSFSAGCDVLALEVFPDAEGLILGVCADGAARWWRKLTRGVMFQTEQKLFPSDLCAALLKGCSPWMRTRLFCIAPPPPRIQGSAAHQRCAIFCLATSTIKVLNVQNMITERSFVSPFEVPQSAWVHGAGTTVVPTVALVGGKQGCRDPLLVVTSPSVNEVSITAIDDFEDVLSAPRRGTSLNPLLFLAQSSACGIVVTVDTQGIIDYVDPSAGATLWEPITTSIKKKGGTPLGCKHVSFTKRLTTDMFRLSNLGATPLSLSIGPGEHFAVAFSLPNAGAHIGVFHLPTAALLHTLSGSDGLPLQPQFSGTISCDIAADVVAFQDGNRGVQLAQMPSGELLLPGDRLLMRDDIVPDEPLQNLRFLQVRISASQKLRNLISSTPLSVSGKSVASFLEGAGDLDPLLLCIAPLLRRCRAEVSEDKTGTNEGESIGATARESCFIYVSRRRAVSDRDWACNRETQEEAEENDKEVGRDADKEHNAATKFCPADYKLHHETKVEMKIRHFGRVVFRLLVSDAPLACYNFATLADRGYYDSLTFHRVIRGFMIQGGCPKGNGTGGESAFPGGDEFPDENLIAAIDRPMLLCMANRGPGTNGSQFFITTGAAPWLTGKHTVFGEVVVGGDVVRAIDSARTDTSDTPMQPIVIEQARVQARTDIS